jgi:hypothetical protein
MLKKPTAQIAQLVPVFRDLVFADTQANTEKTKRAIFCQPACRQALGRKNIEIEE